VSLSEREAIRAKKEAYQEIKEYVERMLSSLEEAAKSLSEAERQRLVEIDLPAERGGNTRLLRWLRKQMKIAEEKEWVSDGAFEDLGEKGLLKFRLKQGVKRGEIEEVGELGQEERVDRGLQKRYFEVRG